MENVKKYEDLFKQVRLIIDESIGVHIQFGKIGFVHKENDQLYSITINPYGIPMLQKVASDKVKFYPKGLTYQELNKTQEEGCFFDLWWRSHLWPSHLQQLKKSVELQIAESDQNLLSSVKNFLSHNYF